jgi:hypothetical protein
MEGFRVMRLYVNLPNFQGSVEILITVFSVWQLKRLLLLAVFMNGALKIKHLEIVLRCVVMIVERRFALFCSMS